MKTCLQLTLVLAILSVAVGCTTIKRMPPEAAPSDYRIQPGDTVEFLLYREQAPTVQTPLLLTVQPDGKVMIPYVGPVLAADRTSKDFFGDICIRLKEIFNSRIVAHFSLTVYQSRTVQVLGFVRSPGQFALTNAMRATDALAQAGGLRLPEAAPNATLLLRRCEEADTTYGVRFSDILSSKDQKTNLVLMPGDVIYVPPTPFRKVALFIEDILSPLHALISPIVAPVTAVFGA